MWHPKLNKSRGGIADQILDALAADVARGALEPGARLPTQRELADSLGVALGTVTRAYTAARERGLIDSRVGSGTVVRSGPDPGPVDLSQNCIRAALAETELLSAAAVRPEPARLLELVDGDQTPAGPFAHREAGAQWIARRGFPAPPERVVVTSGVQHGMFAILANLAAPGDTVLTEHITYAGIRPIASMLRLRLQGLPMDAEGLMPDALAKACRAGAKVLYTTPTLHNPTGITTSPQRRRALAAILERHKVAIVEDDVYGFLVPDGPLPIASILPDQSYYLTSTSKSLFPGLRLGFALTPSAASSETAAAVRATIWEAAPLMGELTATLIRSGALLRVTEEKRRVVDRRREIAASILGRDRLRPAGPSPHLWIDLPSWWHPRDFALAAAAANVTISPAEVFTVDDQPAPRAVRICIGAARHDDQLHSALAEIARLLAHRPAMFYQT